MHRVFIGIFGMLHGDGKMQFLATAHPPEVTRKILLDNRGSTVI